VTFSVLTDSDIGFSLTQFHLSPIYQLFLTYLSLSNSCFQFSVCLIIIFETAQQDDLDIDTILPIPSYPHTRCTCFPTPVNCYSSTCISTVQSPIMDVYTTSFTYPRQARHIHSPASSLDFQGSELRTSSTDPYAATHHLQHANNDVTNSTDSEAIQKLAVLAMSLHGCHVSYFAAEQGRGWNFHITGAYQQVMIARGMILKECPIQARFSFQVTSYSLTPLFTATGGNQSYSL
jgi:hypothetical protein